MIHERNFAKDKQSKSQSSQSDSSSQSEKRNNRQVSIISIEIIEDESKNAITLFHVRNIAQLKY